MSRDSNKQAHVLEDDLAEALLGYRPDSNWLVLKN